MSLEYEKKKMIELRSDLENEKKAKTRDNERYASLVKNASSLNSKTGYRKSKVEYAASHDRKIESIKNAIDACKERIAQERKRK